MRYTAPMTTPTYRLSCLVVLLAACPAGKGTTEGETTADTAGTTGTATTSTTTSSATAVTESSATQDTSGCAPIPCDACGAGCTGQMVCIGSQASCECDCEDPSSSSQGESTSVQESSTGVSGTTGSGTTGSTTTGTSGTTGEPAIACGGDMPFFPEFDRSCAETADCALGFHQIDCCGSLAALGISADAAKLFADAEAECMMQYPQCDCAAKPTVADDGSSTPDNNVIGVSCVDSQCVSFVP